MNISKQEWITLAVGLVIIIGLIFINIRGAASNTLLNNSMDSQNQEQSSTPAQLQITDEKVGTGAEAKTGSTVSVHYTGTFANGQKFDSSRDAGKPFSFTLGAGNVIKGWDQGLIGMKVGGKRKLVIPPGLAYGPNDHGPIPGNSTLYFEVELLDVK
ncbi:FKBP-type peptidyl-prolyl cis-trans isomerase [Candidatus Parcubacteria bacterium]|nr:FKBP-type peptidyl-prolyl cis-trans isomerase [Candidatus Parcubacteria bacterium]